MKDRPNDPPLTEAEKQIIQEYESACHAMQTGVAYDQEFGSQDGSPKHLRVGLNTQKSDHAALVSLLIDKGIIDRHEYFLRIREFMKREVKWYEEMLSKHPNFSGAKVTLG